MAVPFGDDAVTTVAPSGLQETLQIAQAVASGCRSVAAATRQAARLVHAHICAEGGERRETIGCGGVGAVGTGLWGQSS